MHKYIYLFIAIQTTQINSTDYKNNKAEAHQLKPNPPEAKKHITQNHTKYLPHSTQEDHPLDEAPEVPPEHVLKEQEYLKSIDIDTINAYIMDKTIKLELHLNNRNTRSKEVQLILNIAGLETIDMARSGVLEINPGLSIQEVELRTDGSLLKTNHDEIDVELYPFTRSGPYEISIKSRRYRLKKHTENNKSRIYKSITN